MRFPAEIICYSICTTRVIFNSVVIIADQFHPSTLLEIKFFLSKDILKAFMVSEDSTRFSVEIVLPNF